MLIKLGIESKLAVYYETTMPMSMKTARVFKFTPTFTWPMLGLLLYRHNMYMKSDLTKDVVSHDYKLTVIY